MTFARTRVSTYAAPLPPHVRVRIYPQFPLAGGPDPLETILLTPRVGEVGPGPTDRRIYTIDAPTKVPYGTSQRRGRMPPWDGPVGQAVLPSGSGQFDRISPDDPGFRVVHLYGCVRFALDVWEAYLGRPIPWHFRRDFKRLELIALRGWNNAQMGYGALEVGEALLPDGVVADYCLNFDVIAHEVGHAMMMTFAGGFSIERATGDYEALHEASADWAAMIASLHLSGVVEELLETTAGDLDTANRLNRFAELSSTRQIRMANNDWTMWDFVRGWNNEHDLAMPLIAALFDAFVGIYRALLVRYGAIPAALDDIAEMAERETAWRGRTRAGFARAYARHPERFVDVLAEARDIAATLVIGIWERASPTEFRMGDILPILADVDFRQFGGALRPIVTDAFRRRGIGIVPAGPRLRPPGKDSHLHSERTSRP